jgi:signal transduction histidine kinase/DNA-binding response OmpR family regulator
MTRQHSILIIDDTDELPEVIAQQLTDQGHIVYRVHTVAQGKEYLKRPDPPTFILADRILELGPIEVRDLVGLCKEASAVSSEVLVYTEQNNLSQEKQYEILNKGAYRVLDKDDVDKLRDDIEMLLRDFDERTDLMEELNADTSEERSKFITALIGADVSLNVLDDKYRHRYSKTAAELLSKTGEEPLSKSAPEHIGICQTQCWLAQFNQPAVPQKCWGCTVAEVFKSGKPVEGLFLNRQANGSVEWVDVQSKPIKSRTGNTIAVREAVAEASEVVLANLTLERRLKLIAESLIRAGFGRARIYTFDTDGASANLRAAAACQDDPFSPRSDYFDSITSLNLGLNICPYAREADENRIGSFVDKWRPEMGLSPIKDQLKLEPPYFDVPIYRDDGARHSWISVDFVGMDESLREKAIAHYARRETLTWLREEYGREIRLADDTEGKPGYRGKFEIVRRARFGIANARSVDGAIEEIIGSFRDLLPRCRVSVRVKKDHELQEFERLCWGSPDAESIPNFSLDNPQSLSVAVVKHPLPKWIDNYPEYVQKARQTGDPVGYPPKGTRSTAQLPLKLENIVLGTLSISSWEPIQWAEEGYKEPLIALAKDISLVLRDLTLQEEIDRAMNERAATLAFSMSNSADALWRHWAQQRLSEVSAYIGTIRMKLANQTLRDEELTEYLLDISETIEKISKANPAKQVVPKCSTGKVFSHLQKTYVAPPPIPTFDSSADYVLEVPEFVLLNVLMIFLDNARWSIRSSGQGDTVTVSARAQSDCLEIVVSDNGPGIPKDLQARIFREQVQSDKEGQGLGLLYARGAALNYGGDISFTSHPGATRFTLKLPLHQSRGTEG